MLKTHSQEHSVYENTCSQNPIQQLLLFYKTINRVNIPIGEGAKTTKRAYRKPMPGQNFHPIHYINKVCRLILKKYPITELPNHTTAYKSKHPPDVTCLLVPSPKSTIKCEIDDGKVKSAPNHTRTLDQIKEEKEQLRNR